MSFHYKSTTTIICLGDMTYKTSNWYFVLEYHWPIHPLVEMGTEKHLETMKL